MATLEVLQADVTALALDAIANAANTQLRHGGGVAGAIANAANTQLRHGGGVAGAIARTAGPELERT